MLLLLREHESRSGAAGDSTQGKPAAGTPAASERTRTRAAAAGIGPEATRTPRGPPRTPVRERAGVADGALAAGHDSRDDPASTQDADLAGAGGTDEASTLDGWATTWEDAAGVAGSGRAAAGAALDSWASTWQKIDGGAGAGGAVVAALDSWGLPLRTGHPSGVAHGAAVGVQVDGADGDAWELSSGRSTRADAESAGVDAQLRDGGVKLEGAGTPPDAPAPAELDSLLNVFGSQGAAREAGPWTVAGGESVTAAKNGQGS